MVSASTTLRAGAGRASKAFLGAGSSRFTAFNAHQRGALADAPLSRGHVAHVRQMKSGFCRVVSPSVFDASLLNWRGLRSASLSRLHSHRPNSSLGRLVAERAFAGALAITIHHDHHGSRRSVVHSAPCQHISRRLADMVQHLSIALSKSGSSAGFKTSWKDLTREAEPLSPDDKIHD